MSVNVTSTQAASQVYSTYSEKMANTKKSSNYGKTIGEPSLSEEGQKYYEELKKKYGNMDFILVSQDMKEQAKSQAGNYANPSKTVVLIDEDKIEKMATDKNFRKQYEGIISNAASGLNKLQQSMTSSNAKVKGYGIQVNDGGTLSYFAVLEKSTAAQKERIEKKAEEKKLDKKEAEKKADEKKTAEKKADDNTVTITANSLDELMQKISDYTFAQKSDSIQTTDEKVIGQNIDFRG